MMDAPSILHIDRLELLFAPKPWSFANERRAEIDAHFEALRREKPALWNGRVLLMYHHVIEHGVLRGQFLEADYASFSAWRDWGRPAASVRDCFSPGAILTADGAFLLGVMAPHTFNAGKIYFPCGTPDPNDIVDGKVDVDLNIRRELEEETGLDANEFKAEPGWTVIVESPLIAVIKVLRSDETAAALNKRILAHLASEERPELAEIRFVRGPRDIDPAMPRFVTAFLASRFSSA